MFTRTFVMAAALCGALLAAQFPAYSQQYMQRLGGAVDALGKVVADFDASAASLGLTRDQALTQMRGTDFAEKRRADMVRTFARHDRLTADLIALEGRGPFMRAYYAAHFTDREIAQRAWTAFEPALPLTFASLLFALFGFGVTGLALSLTLFLFKPRALPA